MSQDFGRLRPPEWDDVPTPIEFLPLISKVMLRGEVEGGKIQKNIRLEKGYYLRVTTGQSKERGSPNDSPAISFRIISIGLSVPTCRMN